MSRTEKILTRILSGASDGNVPFDDLCWLLEHLGFKLRTKGSHHIFWKEGIQEIINLQPAGNMAKNYQVKQVRNLILKYKLGDADGPV